MYIKEIKDDYELILCKVNGRPMGIIFYENISSISRGIEKVSELSFTVNKFYGKDKLENPLYNELKIERLINLNNTETYVIKNIVEKNETIKTITAYSREKKLYKCNAEFEDICLTLVDLLDVDNCYTLDELLFEDTGWRIGDISDTVRYGSNNTIMDVLNDIKIEVNKDNPKLRYQESVSTNWYDYIMNDISDQFECYPIFDSYNKIIHLYSEEDLGNNLDLILSYDNYLKSNEETTSTEDIVTRLTLLGNNDLNVITCNPTGYKYIEDFSYFIKNREMSDDLIKALERYDTIVRIHTERWNILREEKNANEIIYEQRQKDLVICYSMIQSKNVAIGMTEDAEYEKELIKDLANLNDERALIERDIDILYNKIKEAQKEIDDINYLCKKKNTIDLDTGEKIFTDKLLNELKEFIYHDVYSNDSIVDDVELMKNGKRKMAELCCPTRTWSIDSLNFIDKLIDNEYKNQWEGELGLGDTIILKKDDGTLESVYLVGYTQNPKDKTIELELSDKKTNKDFSLSIGERLTQAKEVYKNYKNNKYLLSSIKLKRLGVNYDKINREIL